MWVWDFWANRVQTNRYSQDLQNLTVQNLIWEVCQLLDHLDDTISPGPWCSDHEPEQLVKKINLKLKQLTNYYSSRMAEVCSYRGPLNLVTQLICERCWAYVSVEINGNARVTLTSNWGPFDEPDLLFTDWPPEDVECSSCGFMNKRQKHWYFCDPEGVIVANDPFPNFPAFTKPQKRIVACCVD